MKKRLMFFKYNRAIALFIVLLSSFIKSFSFDLVEPKTSEDIDLWELTIEQNVNYPVVPKDLQSQINHVVESQYNKLKKYGYNIKLIRNNDVIMLTIPMDELFNGNNYRKVKKGGERILKPLIDLFKVKELFRVVISGHHDVSLSKTESNYITEERVLTISDWLIDMTSNASNIIPYSMGNEFPITHDTSNAGRKKNRRLEIYIIPGKTMLELAKDNKL